MEAKWFCFVFLSLTRVPSNPKVEHCWPLGHGQKGQAWHISRLLDDHCSRPLLLLVWLGAYSPICEQPTEGLDAAPLGYFPSMELNS